jgi:hypothetical protein
VVTDLDELLVTCSHQLTIRRVLVLRQAVKTAARVPGCGLLSDVGSLSARTLSARGTSFVWQAAQRYLAEPSPPHARALATCCVDAYCDLLPADATLPMERSALLPALGGIVDETGGCLASIGVRQDHDRVKLIANAGITVISMPTADLFDAKSNEYIVDNGAEEFAELIAAGLRVIQTVSDDLYRRVIDDVKWVVRVESPSADMHRSFTTAALDDVLFLSDVPATRVRGELVIAEAILHEHSHLHVHRLLNVVKLHTLDDGEQFYSPWRSDPRPLNGLLHGLHVLARLCDFLHAALKSPSYADHTDVRGHFEQRLSWCQVSASVGLLQVPLGALTTEGRILVTDVRRAAELDGRDPDAMTVDSVLAHVELWRSQHEELSAQVEVPQWLHRSLAGRP